MSASERAKKKSLINAANADIKKKASETNFTPSDSPQSQQSQNLNQEQSQPETPSYSSYSNPNSNFVIDDIVIPFDVGNGLFDLFSHHSDGNLTDYNSQRSTPSQQILQNGSSIKHEQNNTPSTNNDFNDDTNSQYNLDAINQPTNSNTNIAKSNSIDTNSNNNNNNNNTDRSQDDFSPNKGITNHLSPTEIDLVDHMFPLFPLVGNQSFESENQPLSTIPQEIIKPSKPPPPQQPKPMRPTVMTHSSSLQNGMASSVNSINSVATSTSTTGNHNQFTSVRLKRPESVLSITSNSSSRSYDVVGNPTAYNQGTFISGSLPMSSTSAAFPPSDAFNNSNSNDDNFGHHSHHFGRTGLGSTSNIGTQLTKIESELYTESFFDENMDSVNINQPNLSASSSVPNFYGVQDSAPANGSVPDLTFANNNDSVSDFGYDKASSVPTNPLEYDIPLYQEMFTPIMGSKPYVFDQFNDYKDQSHQQKQSPITSQAKSSPLKQSPQGQQAQP
ncbi:uncharacterized protein SPAPADRAFT_61659 [Spathaspora passalidarum NRRL Y-27907]|uniref:Uncharacterized protein n=1 Tax=Spathaspora passalidarum (strain NRRL Y-27907 / 11-Y1) TaxID=619300 RepID=G3ANW5_SPAPN|nr:uncharacterized protein SPAPADRAFT_61659 [Spathaspora passalidarum NRRL Y-27907]EGW32590.1 hypothetical protein SPAPADRAFT_61659 [Spathaspora passalidarum NRRL Y-27907]